MGIKLASQRSDMSGVAQYAEQATSLLADELKKDYPSVACASLVVGVLQEQVFAKGSATDFQVCMTPTHMNSVGTYFTCCVHAPHPVLCLATLGHRPNCCRVPQLCLVLHVCANSILCPPADHLMCALLLLA